MSMIKRHVNEEKELIISGHNSDGSGFHYSYNYRDFSSWSKQSGVITQLGSRGNIMRTRDGVDYWYNTEGQLHREDGPAIYGLANRDKNRWFVDGLELSEQEYAEHSFKKESPSGAIYYVDWHGQQHRTDGPARIEKNGNKLWHSHGELHRIGGPAIELTDGRKEWWVDGKRHRTDGPAIEFNDGTKEWWKDGWRHRTDGPAIEGGVGIKEWYVDGEKVTEEEFKEMSWPTVHNEGTTEEYTEWLDWLGRRHRIDGPAVEWKDGSTRWKIHGQLHRLGGPALEEASGMKQWIRDGYMHREDGPAIIYADGRQEWWLNGYYMDSKSPEKKELLRKAILTSALFCGFLLMKMDRPDRDEERVEEIFEIVEQTRAMEQVSA